MSGRTAMYGLIYGLAAIKLMVVSLGGPILTPLAGVSAVGPSYFFDFGDAGRQPDVIGFYDASFFQ